jgi:phosphopantetheinyl transferase (holo-ACP synthase)
MIGNDVIDLQLASRQSNWQRKGFLDKLFTNKEQRLISASENPGISVWNLWSRKEAAYKIFNRDTGSRLFNPVRFECGDLLDESEVRFGYSTFFTRSQISAESIHTVAVSLKADFDRVAAADHREISKKDGLPFYFEEELRPASISHHGKFTRCCYLISDRFNLDRIGQRTMDRTFFGDFE